MSRAEDFALKHFPVEMGLEPGWDDKPVEVDVNRFNRHFAEKVYEWAEQDLALTTEDVMKIIDIATNICGIWMTVDCEEVLRRFNSQREKK